MKKSNNQLIEGENCKRNSKIELLRIMAMILIVFYHFAEHGCGNLTQNNIAISSLWLNFIKIGGKVGVDIFVLISGYYLTNSQTKRFSFRHLFKFWGQVFFYSIFVFLICKLGGISEFSVQSTFKVLFPITQSLWWFASTYFVLYLLHPFINSALNSIDKEKHQWLIMLCVTLWSIISTFLFSDFEGNNLIWFVTLYIIASYEKKYGFKKNWTSKKWFVIFGTVVALTYLSTIIFILLSPKYQIIENHINYFYSQEKISILTISVSLFMTFARLKPCYNKWINIIASTTFGIYLLHTNNFMKRAMWKFLLTNEACLNSLMIIPYSMAVVIFIFVVGAIVDLLRQLIFERAFLKMIDENQVIEKIKKIANKCRIKIFEDTVKQGDEKNNE